MRPFGGKAATLAAALLLVTACGLGDSPGDRDEMSDRLVAYGDCIRQPAPDDPAEIRVWLEPGIGRVRVERVGARLDELPGITSSVYLDGAQVAREIDGGLTDVPDAPKGITVDGLPTLYRLQAERAGDVKEAAEELEALDDVLDVQLRASGDSCQDEREALAEACEARPAERERQLLVFLSGIDTTDVVTIRFTLEARPDVDSVERIGPSLASDPSFGLEVLTRAITDDELAQFTADVAGLAPVVHVNEQDPVGEQCAAIGH